MSEARRVFWPQPAADASVAFEWKDATFDVAGVGLTHSSIRSSTSLSIRARPRIGIDPGITLRGEEGKNGSVSERSACGGRCKESRAKRKRGKGAGYEKQDKLSRLLASRRSQVDVRRA